jgi:hypothetical protein
MIRGILGDGLPSLAEDTAQQRPDDSADRSCHRAADHCTRHSAHDFTPGVSTSALLGTALCGTLLLDGIDPGLALLQISLLLLLLLPHWLAHLSTPCLICS